MKVLELFSGIGGMHFAIKESGVPTSGVVAIDINVNANAVYRHNFPSTCQLTRNIQSFSVEELNRISPDMIVMSPPCQPFTRVGLKKDIEDNRACAFLHLMDVLPQLNDSFKYILVENVKGFETSNARQKLIDFLGENKFIYQEFILTPSQFGIPNSRNRYYLIAKRKPLEFSFAVRSSIITDLSDIGITLDVNNINPLSTILEIGDDFDLPRYRELLVPEKTLSKYFNLMDFVTQEDRRSCCFTRAYGDFIEGTGSIYSPYPLDVIREVSNREKYSSEEQYLEALCGLKLRFFSPMEIARLMCFPDGDFSFPETIKVKQMYRLLGNSINVKVVAFLIRLMVLNS